MECFTPSFTVDIEELADELEALDNLLEIFPSELEKKKSIYILS